jgi:ferrous iron transport protein B
MFAGKQTFLGFNYQGLVLMAMYVLGFVAALLAAYILKRVLKTEEKSYFIMELPVYRKPQWQTVAMLVFDKVKVFLFDAGKIILAISVVLWFLNNTRSRQCF